MLANRLTPCGHEGCTGIPLPEPWLGETYTCDSPAWKYNYDLVGHDAGSISVMVKRMLEDGSGGYVVFRDGVQAGWPMDYWGRMYSTFPPRPDSLVHPPEDGYALVCPPPPCATPPPPTPPPQPSPSASAPPPTPPPPTGCGTCPAPIGIKLGFSPNPVKIARGYRNLASITPLVIGDCCHKGDPSPTAQCAVSEGCADHIGSAYQVRYGQPEAWQTGTGFTRDPVDRQTDGCNRDDPYALACGYNLTFATNSAEDWTNGADPECLEHARNCGSFRGAGAMEVCVSLPPLPYWRCQRGEMGADGLMRGFGKDEKSYNVAKPPGEARLTIDRRKRVFHTVPAGFEGPQ